MPEGSFKMAKSGTVGQPGAAYTFVKGNETVRRHTFAVIVDNEPGVLARVIGLFSGRGYNIESLTVSTVTDDESASRINIVTTGTEMVIEQIKAQLERLVPVHNVHDLTLEGAHVEKELALVKVRASDHNRRESLRIADVFDAKVADTTLESFVFQIEGTTDKVDSFIELMQALGDTEIARSGVVAIARGSQIVKV
ncbi:MAG: acetolactate synthase small subunit [Alphaproteobacteria bacterium]